MFRRSLSAILLTAFTAVSVLGHGGLHLLPGAHDCHSHGGHRHAHAGHDHAPGAHGHCCSHSHTDAGSPQQPSQPAPHAPHQHDHENCLVCQWHAQGQLWSVTLAVPLSQACSGEVTRPDAQVTAAYRLSNLTTRGPPVA